MNWLHYLAEANLYLGVFYLAYCVFLTKETHYQLNRGYLLFSCVMSFVLPVLQVGALKPAEPVAATISYTAPQEYISVANQFASAPAIPAPVLIETHHLTMQGYLWYTYIIGAAILLIILTVKLYTLFRLTRNAQRVKQDKYKLIYIPGTDVAFSFFNYLFIGTHAAGANTIITHELVHIRQRHSVDIVFLELLKVVSWFNPFIYLLQNSLKTVHEYIADEQTVAYQSDAISYSAFLVNNAYGAGGSSITHAFFNYSLLKKRILMLNQQRSGKNTRLKYLAALPLCAVLLCISTLAFSKTYGWVDLDPAKPAVNITAAHPSKITAKGVNPIGSKRKPPFPIPSVTSKGYNYLFHQVMKTVSYNPAENDKGGFVVVGFDVANNGMLTNIKIEKSGGKEFDAKALNAYKTFNMPVGDKPGHRKSLIIFYNGQSIRETNVYRGGDQSYISSWVISGVPYPYTVKRTAKGFEYDEYLEHLDDKFNARVVIYGANGKYVMVSLNEATAAEVALLKHKYGYTFPQLPKGPVKFPPPIVKHVPDPPLYIIDGQEYQFSNAQRALLAAGANIIATANQMKRYPKGDAYALSKWGKDAKNGVILLDGNANIHVDGEIDEKARLSPNEIQHHQYTADDDTTATPDWEQINKYFANNIKYIAEDRRNGNKGRVDALFSLDGSHQIRYIKVVRAPSETLAAEVMRVLKKAGPVFRDLKTGVQYALPVDFTLDYDNGATADVKQANQPVAVGNSNALIYNPNNVDIPNSESLMLSGIVIRGYVKH